MKFYLKTTLTCCAFLSFSCVADSVVTLKPDVAQSATMNKYYEFYMPANGHVCTSLNASGYMLGHSHGLPTQVQITDAQANCKLSGVLFSMPGQWFIDINLGKKHVATYSFKVR